MAGRGGTGGAVRARGGRFGSPVPLRRARIEIIPLIDVMFFLLASFMMVSLSMQRAETFRMDLPVAGGVFQVTKSGTGTLNHVELNGVTMSGVTFDHAELRGGGTLVFVYR